jgi:hypothetical protein
MAIFALGIMPYISASIIVQLLTGVSDYFKNLKEQGEIGRKKITQITRYGTVFIAAMQGYGVSVGLENAGNLVLTPGIYFQIDDDNYSSCWHNFFDVAWRANNFQRNWKRYITYNIFMALLLKYQGL